MTLARLAVIFKSKLFWGTVLAAGANLLAKDPMTLSDILTFAGTVFAAAGARDAIAKHGAVDNPTVE